MSTRASGQGATGVIHNIGYRNYDGPRLGRFDVGRALFSQTLRGSFGVGRGARTKIFPWFLVLCAMIPAFIIVAIETESHRTVFQIGQYTAYVQVVPTLFVALVAPQAVSRDLRFHTLPLYFSRPLGAVDYVRAKFAGVAAGLLAILVAPLLLLYVGAIMVGQPVGAATGELFAALFGVLLFAALLSGLALLISSVTPRRGLGMAAIIAVVFGSYGASSMFQGILSVTSSPDAAVYGGLLSPVSMYQMAQSGLWDVPPDGVVVHPDLLDGVIFTVVMVALTVGCYQLLKLRYRKVASS